MKKLFVILTCCFLIASCTIRNATILRYNSENAESLQIGKTGDIKLKKSYALFVGKDSNSTDTLNYESLWGYVKNGDTLRTFENNEPWRFEHGSVNCVAIYSRITSRYRSIGKKYFFSTKINMKPIEAANNNVIKHLFNNDKSSFKAFKKQNKLRSSYNVDIIKKYIQLNCQ
jgi:hypothetical protein